MTGRDRHLFALLEKLHEVIKQPMVEGAESRVKAMLSANTTQTDMAIASPLGPEMVEPFFYVGTGAYDFQYLDLANEKYHHDTDWIASNAGLSVDLMVSAARNSDGNPLLRRRIWSVRPPRAK